MSFFKIPILRLRFQVRAVDRIDFGSVHGGSKLNGGIRWALRKQECSQPQIPIDGCPECPEFRECVYAETFEDVASVRERGRLSQIPRPMILELPRKPAQVYLPGETFDFGLVLVGETAKAGQRVISAIHGLGERDGVGIGKGRFALESVTADRANPTVSLWPTLNAESLFYDTSSFLDAEDSDELVIRFVTPLTMTVSKKFIREAPEFKTLLDCLIRDLQSLREFHAPEMEWPREFEPLSMLAGQVELVEGDVEWTDWGRKSANNPEELKFGGLTGYVRYRGSMGLFLPLLRLGQLFHIGKRRAFGNGQIELEDASGIKRRDQTP